MDFELFKQIINECSEYGPRSFSLHLFGEPLLYPNIIEAIEYIKSKNRRNTVLLTTNGTLLNKFVKRILAVGTDRIIWSYRKNNFNSESLDALKKIGLIRLLIEETPKEEFEKWSKFPRVEIKHLHNYGGQIDTTKWGLENNKEMDRYPCYHLWLAPAIRWNGDITICCNDASGREVIGSYLLGNSLSNYWKSGVLTKMRQGHLKGEYKGLCTNCNVWKTYPDMFFSFQQKPNHVATPSSF